MGANEGLLSYKGAAELTSLSRQSPARMLNDGKFPSPVKYGSRVFFVRAEMKRYNALLRRSFIDIGDLEKAIHQDQHWNKKFQSWETRTVQVNHFNKFVRRIFYRGSWEYGGRLHGGFWQQVNEDVRKKILINDFTTVELDFSGLHINIAYELEGLTPLSADAYQVELIFNVTAEEQREWMKSLSLMCFKAKSLNVLPRFTIFTGFKIFTNALLSTIPPKTTCPGVDKMGHFCAFDSFFKRRGTLRVP